MRQRSAAEPSREELAVEFDAALIAARTEAVLLTPTRLDLDVDNALAAVAAAAPDPSPELVAAAEAAFAGMLDGSNAARVERERLAHMTTRYSGYRSGSKDCG